MLCCVVWRCAVWERLLQHYMSQHPHVKLIDKLDCIRTLQNRATMLTPLTGNGIVIQVTPMHLSVTPAVVPMHATTQSPQDVVTGAATSVMGQGNSSSSSLSSFFPVLSVPSSDSWQ